MPKTRQKKRAGLPIWERIQRYLDRRPPAISGSNGHDTTFQVALALVRGFDLSPDYALRYLQYYNQRCQPLWSETELRHKLESADTWQPATVALRPRGYLLESTGLKTRVSETKRGKRQ